MTGRASECKQPERSGPSTQRVHYAIWGAICALVVGVYAWSAKSGCLALSSSSADNSYYDLLMQGFRDGQIILQREMPSGLAHLRLAERACELTTNPVAIYLDTLGVAYSEAGRFKEVVQATERGAAQARAAGNQELGADREPAEALSGKPTVSRNEARDERRELVAEAH